MDEKKLCLPGGGTYIPRDQNACLDVELIYHEIKMHENNNIIEAAKAKETKLTI